MDCYQQKEEKNMYRKKRFVSEGNCMQRLYVEHNRIERKTSQDYKSSSSSGSGACAASKIRSVSADKE